MAGRRLEGKVALVTGAAMGMGAAHARRLAAEGAAVVLTDIADEPGRLLADELRTAGHRATYLTLDVTSPTRWREVAGETAALYAGLHVLVNNAGVSDASPLRQTSDEAWDRIIAINQTGVFLGMRECIPLIARSGGGSVVNISSVFGLRSSPGYLGYHASKAAVVLMTKSAAADHGGDGVRVNAICPGLVRTPLLAAEDQDAVEAMAQGLPLRRVADPDEISTGVVFLASDEASFVTGAALVMDGGQLTH